MVTVHIQYRYLKLPEILQFSFAYNARTSLLLAGFLPSSDSETDNTWINNATGAIATLRPK